ncbi:hypothetical protein [Aquisphaera insulae]|nr:hypothetical protein [Aquisphaera insulae]
MTSTRSGPPLDVTVEGIALDDQVGAFLNQATVDYPQTTALRNKSCGPAA